MSEKQWQGSGTIEIEDATVIFSGIDKKINGNQRGVAVALRNEMRNEKKKDGTFDPVSEKLLKVRLISRGVSIISVYAPTEVDEDTEAERFYDELQDLVINANKKDILIILGDFNA